MSHHEDYWLLLLQGAHIEACIRQQRGVSRRRPPVRVQETIDRIRRERGLPPLYPKEKAA